MVKCTVGVIFVLIISVMMISLIIMVIKMFVLYFLFIRLAMLSIFKLSNNPPDFCETVMITLVNINCC